MAHEMIVLPSPAAPSEASTPAMSLSERVRLHRRQVGHVRMMAITLLIGGVLVASCGLTHTTLRVDPAVLNEARSIGGVLGESTSNGYYEGTTDVITTLVVGTRGKNSTDSVKKAMKHLGGRGWKTTNENLPVSVTMESPNWETNELVLRPFDPMYLENEPEILEAINRAVTNPEALVIVWAWVDGSRA